MIEFPAINDQHLKVLMVCSHLRTTDKGLLRLLRKLPASDDALFAKGASGNSYVMAFGDGPKEKKGVHFHINILHNPNKPPVINSARSNIASLLQPFVGVAAYVTVAGIFHVPVDRISKDEGFIGMSLTEENVGPLKIQQTGGNVSVKDGPRLEWMLRNDKHEVRIEISIHHKERIRQEYLETAYKRIEIYFKELVGVTHGKSRAKRIRK